MTANEHGSCTEVEYRHFVDECFANSLVPLEKSESHFCDQVLRCGVGFLLLGCALGFFCLFVVGVLVSVCLGFFSWYCTWIK